MNDVYNEMFKGDISVNCIKNSITDKELYHILCLKSNVIAMLFDIFKKLWVTYYVSTSFFL